jgi:hypothetical protein
VVTSAAAAGSGFYFPQKMKQVRRRMPDGAQSQEQIVVP